MEFHIELPGSKALNDDQEFFVHPDALRSVPLEFSIIQEIPEELRGKEYLYVGMTVSANKARGVGTPENPYYVPVMLNYEPNEQIKITLYDEKKEQVFSKTVNYTLPLEIFPKPILFISHASDVRENWHYVDKSDVRLVVFSADYSVALVMTIMVAISDENNEPIAFYGARIHALRKLAVLMNKEKCNL